MKLAVDALGLGDEVKTDSAEVSSADSGETIEPGGAWVATVATDPAVVGAASVRAAALALAGRDPGHRVAVEPTLPTKAALRAAGDRTSTDSTPRSRPSAGPRPPARPGSRSRSEVA